MFEEGYKRLNETARMRWVPLIGADWRAYDLLVSAFLAFGGSGAVPRLESYLARFMGTSVVATDQGRTAIMLALATLGLGNGEEVVVPSLVCPTVIRAIIKAGCRPVFADVAAGGITVTVEELEPLLTETVKAVLVPHLYYLQTPMGDIEALCRRKGVALIDDAAQVFGVLCDGRYLGTYGDFGVLSFGPFKGLSSLRGGALLVRSPEHAERVRSFTLKQEGTLAPFRRCLSGYVKYFRRGVFLDNRSRYRSGLTSTKVLAPAVFKCDYGFNLTSFDANLTRILAEKYEKIFQMRSASAKNIFNLLDGNPFFDFIGEPNAPYVKIPVKLKKQLDVSLVVSRLRENRIECEQLYRPAHLREEFKLYANRKLPNTEFIYRQIFLFPNPYRHDGKAIVRLGQFFEALEHTL